MLLLPMQPANYETLRYHQYPPPCNEIPYVPQAVTSSYQHPQAQAILPIALQNTLNGPAAVYQIGSYIKSYGPYQAPIVPSCLKKNIESPALTERTPYHYDGKEVNFKDSTFHGAPSNIPERFSPSFTPELERSSSILYHLLNQYDQGYSSSRDSPASSTASPMTHHDNCSSDILQQGTTKERSVTSRFVGIQDPSKTCQEASKVLIKSISFIKNLASFKNLSTNDQMLLFQNSWSELFVVGLAQEKIDYDTVEYELTVKSTDQNAKNSSIGSSNPSSLHALPILREQRGPRPEEASKIKSFIRRCWDLELTTAEYAYFMGTVLFDPGLPGLKDRDVIASLQMEARNALAEYCTYGDAATDSKRDRHIRLGQILLGLPALRSVKIRAVIDLFFRPIFGSDKNLENMLIELISQ